MRYIKHTELPLNEPWPVEIRERHWRAKVGAKYGPEWTIQAGLPVSNPNRDGSSEYDIEWVILQTTDAKLVEALETGLEQAPSFEQGDRIVYRLFIVRGKDGRKNRWDVRFPDRAPAANAARQTEGELADLVEQFRRLYLDILGVLLGPVPPIERAPKLYKVTAARCAAELLRGRGANGL